MIKVTPLGHRSKAAFGSSTPRFPGGDNEWVRELPHREVEDEYPPQQDDENGGVEDTVAAIENGEGTWSAVDPAVRDAVSMLLRVQKKQSSAATWKASQQPLSSDPFDQQHDDHHLNKRNANNSNAHGQMGPHSHQLDESTGRELQYANAPDAHHHSNGVDDSLQQRYRSPGSSARQPVAGHYCHGAIQAGSSYSPYGHKDPAENADRPWVAPAYRTTREEQQLGGSVGVLKRKSTSKKDDGNNKSRSGRRVVVKDASVEENEQHPTSPDHAGSSYSPLMRDRTKEVTTFGEATKHRSKAVKNISHLYRNVAAMDSEVRQHIHPQAMAAIQLDPELMKILRRAAAVGTTVNKKQGTSHTSKIDKSDIPEELTNKLIQDEKNFNDFTKSLHRTARLFTRFMDGFLTAEEEAAVAYQRCVTDTDTTEEDEDTESSITSSSTVAQSSSEEDEDDLIIPEVQEAVVEVVVEAPKKEEVMQRAVPIQHSPVSARMPETPLPIVKRSVSGSSTYHVSNGEHPCSNHEGRPEEIASPSPPNRLYDKACPHPDMPPHAPYPTEPKHRMGSTSHDVDTLTHTVVDLSDGDDEGEYVEDRRSVSSSRHGSSTNGGSPSPATPPRNNPQQQVTEASSSPKLRPGTRANSHVDSPSQQQTRRVVVLNVQEELIAEPKTSRRIINTTNQSATSSHQNVAVHKGKGPHQPAAPQEVDRIRPPRKEAVPRTSSANKRRTASPTTTKKERIVLPPPEQEMEENIPATAWEQSSSPVIRAEEILTVFPDVPLVDEAPQPNEEEAGGDAFDDELEEDVEDDNEVATRSSANTVDLEARIAAVSQVALEEEKEPTATFQAAANENEEDGKDGAGRSTQEQEDDVNKISSPATPTVIAVGPTKSPTTIQHQGPTSTTAQAPNKTPYKKKVLVSKRPQTKQGPSPSELANRSIRSTSSKPAAGGGGGGGSTRSASMISGDSGGADGCIVPIRRVKGVGIGEEDVVVVVPLPEEITRGDSDNGSSGAGVKRPSIPTQATEAVDERPPADAGIHPPSQDPNDGTQMAIRPKLQSSKHPEPAADPPQSVPPQAPTPRDENLGPSRTRTVSAQRTESQRSDVITAAAPKAEEPCTSPIRVEPKSATPVAVEPAPEIVRIGRRALDLRNLKVDSDSDSD
jgi:hypothetical protein